MLTLGLAYSRASADASLQARIHAEEVQNQLLEFAPVRSQVQKVIEILSEPRGRFPNRPAVIQWRVWELQTVWSDFKERPHFALRGAPLDDGRMADALDALTLAALRSGTSASNKFDFPYRDAKERDAIATLTEAMSTWEHGARQSLARDTAVQNQAVTSLALGRTFTWSAFYGFSALVVLNLCFPAIRGMRRRISAPVGGTHLDAGKLASTER